MTFPETVPLPVTDPPPSPSPRLLAIAVSGMTTALGLAVLSILPCPYTVERPGPTFDLLAEPSGTPMLAIDGETTYETTGELRMTTVDVSYGSNGDVTFGTLLATWLSPYSRAMPDVYVYDVPSIQQEWVTSIDTATVAALAFEGTDVPMATRVTEVMDGSNAVGLLEPDDIVVSINGRAIETYPDLEGALDGLAPGDDVTVTVDRSGEERTFTFATVDDGAGGAMMGIWIFPEFSLPITVDPAIDNVGGPSGGMMLALGIVDLLTPVDELRGAKVAGTGTIDLDGTVGPIGGIRSKMAGANADGAEWFLAPHENCPEVVGYVPSGLTVVSVTDLDDAYHAIVAIGAGTGSSLPTCS